MEGRGCCVTLLRSSGAGAHECVCCRPQVKKLLDAAYERARAVLRENEHELHALASELLEKESLTGTQARAP